MASESTKDHLLRLLTLRGEVLGWIDPEEVDRLAFQDIANVAKALDLPTALSDKDEVRCEKMLTGYLANGGGELVHRYLADAVESIMAKVSEALASVPRTEAHTVVMEATEAALKEQERERQSLRGWGFEVNAEALPFGPLPAWERLLIVALVDPYERHSRNLTKALAQAIITWGGAKPKHDTSTPQASTRPELNLVALVHAFRYLSKDKSADITRDNDAALAEHYGYTSKDSGRILRTHFERYTNRPDSHAQRLDDAKRYTVKARYVKACEMLKEYPKALALAQAELEELADRE